MNYQHILLAVDDSPIAFIAAEQVRILAKALGSQVTIASVVVTDPLTSVSFYNNVPGITDYSMQAQAHAKNILTELSHQFTEQGISAESKILTAQSPSNAITKLADELNVDLIVVGSHGRTGFKKAIIGSVAQDILTSSHIPVLVIKYTK